MTSVDDYLEILPADSRALAGLRWSAGRDALEHGDGRTFAHFAEVFGFLEGFAARAPLMHFGHALHFLYLLRHGSVPGPVRHDFLALSKAWQAAGRPARTAGAFCSFLCRDVPAVGSPPSPGDLATWLDLFGRRAGGGEVHLLSLAEAPVLSPEEFEARLAVALEGLTEQELFCWFRDGCPPVREKGDELARRLLANKPPTLEAVLAEVSRHDRLSAAVPFVSRLVSALALPPRRLIDRELPLGGYADVTTRGLPEQVLPAQLALDELEFLRRYAENELLFYRREAPASRTREELVVLLDQGVRTWGRVRLVLAAAVFALGQFSFRRQMPLLLGGTSNGGRLIDPLETPAPRVAELLAASDLTEHPGLALEQALTDGGVQRRDVVLLTHPRNLGEADVLAAARAAPPHSRLFALAVDAHGDAGFSELRRGSPVVIAQFHLDLAGPVDAPRREAGPSWAGPVEPVGFPFRFGLANHERFHFGFDHAGEWLLTATRFGMLCVTHVDGGGHEILPRALLGGQVFTEIGQVLGVPGGFVVCGSTAGLVLVAAHYDLANRAVKVYEFPAPAGSLAGGVEWRYVRRKHLLTLRIGERLFCVSLHTGKRDETVSCLTERSGCPSLKSRLAPLLLEDGVEAVLVLDQKTGALSIPDAPAWREFVPLSDGRPALVGHTLMRAECHRDVLAALFVGPPHNKQVWLFRGPEGRTVATFPVAYDRDGFTLSSDGGLLAVQRGACQLEVRGTDAGANDVRCVSPVGRFHNNVVVELGDGWLAVAIDRTVHLVRWDSGRLERSLLSGDLRTVLREAFSQSRVSAQGRRAAPGPPPPWLKYDPVRFRLSAWGELVAVVDAYGEVFLFERTGELVCSFFAFRQQLAAWAPDGTRFGAEALLGGPPTPEADRILGRALRRAGGPSG
jgi:hypothetical protein